MLIEVRMVKTQLSPDIKKSLKSFLERADDAELIAAYLYYIEKKFQLEPVLFVKDKTVYKTAEDAIQLLEKENKLWRETEIKIGYTTSVVNESTKKIYICPFTGKVFGDNTHPNPQDAIYDWVSTCPENKERVGGLRVKRFYISEDPEVIKNYASKTKPKAPINKIVFSSQINGQLFHSKEAVIDDCKANYLNRVSLQEVQNQSRFQIEQSFMEFIQKQLADEKIASFVEGLSDDEEFHPYIEQWIGEVEQES